MAKIIHKMVIALREQSLFLFFSDTELAVSGRFPTTELVIVYSVAQFQQVYDLAPSVFASVPFGFDHFKQSLVAKNVIPLASDYHVEFVSGPAAAIVAQGILLAQERAETKKDADDLGVVRGFLWAGVTNQIENESLPILLLFSTNEESEPLEVLAVFSIVQLGELLSAGPISEDLWNYYTRVVGTKPQELFAEAMESRLLPLRSSEPMIRLRGSLMRFFLLLLNESVGLDKADKGTPPIPPSTPSGQAPN